MWYRKTNERRKVREVKDKRSKARGERAEAREQRQEERGQKREVREACLQLGSKKRRRAGEKKRQVLRWAMQHPCAKASGTGHTFHQTHPPSASPAWLPLSARARAARGLLLGCSCNPVFGLVARHLSCRHPLPKHARAHAQHRRLKAASHDRCRALSLRMPHAADVSSRWCSKLAATPRLWTCTDDMRSRCCR